jgi:hypothetical protein
MRFSVAIQSYDSTAKALRSALTLRTLRQKQMPAAQEVGPISAHLKVFSSNRSPLAVIRNIVVLLAFQPVFVHHPLLAAHLAPHGKLCQEENIDILKGKLQVLEILALWRLLCDTIPAQIP